MSCHCEFSDEKLPVSKVINLSRIHRHFQEFLLIFQILSHTQGFYSQKYLQIRIFVVGLLVYYLIKPYCYTRTLPSFWSKEILHSSRNIALVYSPPSLLLNHIITWNEILTNSDYTRFKLAACWAEHTSVLKSLWVGEALDGRVHYLVLVLHIIILFIIIITVAPRNHWSMK